jgi:hypothetical protein
MWKQWRQHNPIAPVLTPYLTTAATRAQQAMSYTLMRINRLTDLARLQQLHNE